MPDQRMTKEEGRAFKTRWRLVNELEIEEMRQATPETRLRQFFALRDWAIAFGWEKALEEGVDVVRARWVRLWKAQRGQAK